MDPESDKSLAARICLPFLRTAQNSDGGWGFHRSAASRAESTCWALFALMESSQQSTEDRAIFERGRVFLASSQLADGSWPATSGDTTGSWVTSLCCWTLLASGDHSTMVQSGLRWICDDWPSDSSPWRRFLARFASDHNVAPVNYRYRGWSWTPGTSSWVEPTSFALLALESAESGQQAPGAAAKRRRQLGTSLLYDRLCPGGGWNAGNPMVYGVPGEPLAGPTVWALLALHGEPARAENVSSLEWLERAVVGIRSPGSLALAKIGLAPYEREWPSGAPSLNELVEKNGFLESVPIAAWIRLATSSDFLARALGLKKVAV